MNSVKRVMAERAQCASGNSEMALLDEWARCRLHRVRGQKTQGTGLGRSRNFPEGKEGLAFQEKDIAGWRHRRYNDKEGGCVGQRG